MSSTITQNYINSEIEDIIESMIKGIYPHKTEIDYLYQIIGMSKLPMATKTYYYEELAQINYELVSANEQLSLQFDKLEIF